VPLHQLHLVTEPRRDPSELVRVVGEALDGGVDWVQLRNKSASAAAMYADGIQLRSVTQNHQAFLAINDRLDVALALGADGVHLAGQSLPVEAAVRLATGRALIGRSVHSLPDAMASAKAGADYLTFGHVFPTTSHPGLPPHGLTELAEIVHAVNVAVLAIGGITADNLDSVLQTGCAGIAVISAILADPEPDRAARRLRSVLNASTHQPRYSFPVPARGEPHAAHRQPTTV